jgi:hypothetical protein
MLLRVALSGTGLCGGHACHATLRHKHENNSSGSTGDTCTYTCAPGYTGELHTHNHNSRAARSCVSRCHTRPAAQLTKEARSDCVGQLVAPLGP